MSFRDLRDFNLAMLAKQGWRLIQENDSLLYKCFKARYFPRSSFLEAKESPGCSYVCGEVYWLPCLFLDWVLVGGLVMGLP